MNDDTTQLLEDVRRARSALEEAENAVGRLRGAYHRLIARAHKEGLSLRALAENLEMSHQRVHQIVDGVSCSLCGVRQADAQHIVAAKDAAICDLCVFLADEVLQVRRELKGERSTLSPSGQGTCSFCAEGRRRIVKGGSDARICSECVAMSIGLLVGIETERERSKRKDARGRGPS